MQLITVHLYDPEIAAAYIDALRRRSAPQWGWWQDDLPTLLAADMSEADAARIGTGLALAMADAHPTYHSEGFGLTPWEAMYDRGVGMFMRPPARVFVDHGINPIVTGRMPIRLDLQGGIMAGAWIPPHLIPQLDQMIEERLERWAKRIHEAEVDPYPLLATMRMVTDDALRSGLGIIEAINILAPGFQVVETPDRKRMNASLRMRIDAAIEPEKKSFLDRFRKKD
ncbi:MAG: hypothetical protein KC435_03010 [Thermomicrobiales bacterium]|nr:hypothetical protein [Thermomicrobiales bacterium]